MPTLVTGATGFVGRHLTEILINHGEAVRILARDAMRVPAGWRDKLDVVVGDLTDRTTQERALRGVSVVFNLAGEIHDVAVMDRVNVDAVRVLLDLATRSGVEQLIHLSSVGVVGASQPGSITEETPCTPRNAYERSKLAAERLVLNPGLSGDMRVIVVRPTTIFGEGASPFRDSLLRWLRVVQQRRFVFVGRNAIANYVYVKDVAGTILRLSAVPDLPSAVWNVADPAPMRDFVGAMANALGVSNPTASLPIWTAYAMGAALESANRLVGLPAPLTRARVRALSTQSAFSAAKLAALGVELQFGYRVGLERTIDWYRSAGQLT